MFLEVVEELRAVDIDAIVRDGEESSRIGRNGDNVIVVRRNVCLLTAYIDVLIEQLVYEVAEGVLFLRE